MTHENDNTTRTCETMIYAGITERVCRNPAIALIDADSVNEHAICGFCASLSDHSRLTFFEQERYEDDPKREIDSLLVKALLRTVSLARIIAAFEALDSVGQTLVLAELRRIASEEPREEED